MASIVQPWLELRTFPRSTHPCMRNYMYVLFIYRNHVIESHFRSSDRVKEVSPLFIFRKWSRNETNVGVNTATFEWKQGRYVATKEETVRALIIIVFYFSMYLCPRTLSYDSVFELLSFYQLWWKKTQFGFPPLELRMERTSTLCSVCHLLVEFALFHP